MRKLLFITYEFPPINNTESVRSLKSVKYFQEFGWNPVVLTAKRTHGLEDISLLSELPKKISIHRTYSFENKLFNYLLSVVSTKILRWSYLQEYMITWLPFAIRRGKNILKKEKIEVIISRSSPTASHIIALKLKLFSNLPWIADFSDPWTQNPYISYDNKTIQRIDEYLERKVASIADKIIFTSKYAKTRFLEKYKTIPEDKVVVIPNSYDASDYSDYKEDTPEHESIKYFHTKIEKRNKFTITYTGNFYGTRTPEPFLKALKLLKKVEDINGKIEVKLIGGVGDFEHLISKYKLNEIVSLIKRVPRKEVFPHLYNSDILLLIDAPSDTHSVFMPSKLAEYIRMGIPILAITPEGASADIIRATKTGVVVSPDDVESIKEALRDLYNLYLNSKLKINPDWNEIKKYSAERCTELLVRVMEEVVRK